MDRLDIHPDDLILDGHRAQAELARLELELGFTFLDVASNTRDSLHAQRCVLHAIATLRTVNRFLKNGIVLADADIHERREQLRQRLHAVWSEPHRVRQR